jgi:hypothetical protein
MTDGAVDVARAFLSFFANARKNFVSANASGEAQQILTFGRRIALSTQCESGWLSASLPRLLKAQVDDQRGIVILGSRLIRRST